MPIAMISTVASVLVVHPSVPARNLGELLAMARAKPGELNYGSSGTGSAQHLFMELLKQMTGVDITHIPYRGTGPAVVDTIGGRLSMMFDTTPTALPHIQGGRVRAIAVTTARRDPALPDVPTMIELGYPSVDTNNWHGFVAPARVPEPILERLHGALAGAIKDPEISRQLFDQGAVPGGNSRAEFGDFIKAEMTKWGEVIRRGNIRAD
jgi:tripartite-type tricarboxylate transporter receptor subunit TctC